MCLRVALLKKYTSMSNSDKKFVLKLAQNIHRIDKEQVQTLIIEMMQESEQMKIVLHSLQEGIVVLTEDHLIQFVNIPAQRLISMSKKTNIPIEEGILDPDIGLFLKTAVAEQSNVIEKEFSITNDRKGARIISLSVLPLVQDGTIVGTLITIRDITEKRMKEVQLQQAEHLASLTTLTAGVAHEIKNPLASMSIHLQLIQKKLKIQDVSIANIIYEHLDVISEEIDRLNRTIVDFLFAARPVNIQPVKQNINTVIIEVLEFLRYEFEEHSIRVQSDLAEMLPEIAIDDRYVKQSLLSILKNAISAMTEGKASISVTTKEEKGSIRITIVDNGIGIDPETMKNIFQPFYTTKESGSGLGLTMVYKIVKDHGGDVAIRSKKGEGTSVTLLFPVPQSANPLIEKEGHPV